jgi:hypothetical protein
MDNRWWLELKGHEITLPEFIEGRARGTIRQLNGSYYRVESKYDHIKPNGGPHNKITMNGATGGITHWTPYYIESYSPCLNSRLWPDNYQDPSDDSEIKLLP